MALPLPNTPQVEIVRLTKALYNAAPGNTYLSAFEDSAGTTTNGMTTFANWLASTVSTSAATLATTVVTNLGLTGDVATAATAYLNAGFAADPSNLGRVILDAMNALSTLTTDATYGTAASSFNDVVATAYTYSINTANTSTNLATLQAAAVTDGTNALTLTTGIDTITGSSGVDMITGGMGTLSTLDEINGGAGVDSLTVTFAPTLASAGSATGAAPTLSGVEIITLTNNADTATFDMANVYGETALTLAGRNTLGVTNMDLTAVTLNGMSAQVTLDLATATASTAAYGLTLNMSGATATVVVFAEDTATTAQADVLTINALGNVGNGSTAQLDVSGMEQIVLSGAGNVNLNFATGTWANNFNDLTAIKASGMTGSLTLRFGDDANDMNIVAGAGNDTFNFTAALGTNDIIDGGAGDDVLNAMLTGYQRPTLSNVETLNLSHLVGAASAATADFRDVSGVTTLNLKLDTAMVFDKMGSSVVTINVNSSDTTANDLTLKYGTAAAASNVTLNLGNGVNGIFQTAAATATAMALGDVALSGNSGSLNVVVNSTANYQIDTLAALDFTAVTINAASGSLSAVDDINVGTAQTVTLIAGAAKAIQSTADLSAMGANSLTLNADGQSASITLGTAHLGTANTVTIETDAAMTGNAGVTVSALTFQTAGAATGAVNLDTITINALGGDVTVGSSLIHSGATAINLGINVTMGSTAVDVTLGQLTIVDVVTAATGSEQSVNLTLAGTGNFTLNTALVATANLTFSVNSTALASGSNVTIDLSDIDDTGTTVSAVFGAHSGSFIGGDGADNIEFGLGTMKANGGLGNDTITLGNTAVSQVEFYAAASALAGLDTIVGAGAGDIILFQGMSAIYTATGVGSATAFLTGTSTNTSQIGNATMTAYASGVARSAVDAISIYTSNGDTIIEVLLAASADGTAANLSGLSAATAGDVFAKVTLSNKDFTAITAAFQIHQNASGLQITLL